jgi:hypothetical protein
MTEQEWRVRHDLERMVAFVEGHARPRKLRLFACACCLRHDHWVEETPAAEALGVALAFADGHATTEQLVSAARAATACANHFYAMFRETGQLEPYYAHVAASACAQAAAETPGELLRAAVYAGQVQAYAMCESLDVSDIWREYQARETADQAALIRDIFGNPFRPATPDLAWRTATAVALAQMMYNSREFSAMPILADALQDAGCDSADMLDHCRDPKQVHVRGCWAVDLVLGKS